MSENVYCAYCGKPHALEDTFCPFCGRPVAETSAASETPLAAAPEAPQEAAPRHPAKRPSRTVWFIGGGALALLVVLVALGVAVMLFINFNPFAVRDRIILGVPNRAGEVDVYLLRLNQTLKQGAEILQNMRSPDSVFFYIRRDDDYQLIGGLPSGYNFGGFVPGANYVLYWYLDNDDVAVRRLDFNRREPAKILDANSPQVWGIVLNDPNSLFVIERSGQQMRCYISRLGKEAERLGKGDGCQLPEDSSRVFIQERSQDGLSLTAIGMDRSKEVILLDKDEAVTSFRVSSDGSHVAYVRASGSGETRLVVINARDGEQITESAEWYNIVSYDFARRENRLFYVAENEEGDWLLFTSDDHATPIATGVTIRASFSPAGDHLIYMIGDEDGEETLRVHQAGAAEEVEVLSGRELAYALSPALNHLLISNLDDDEVILYTATFDGRNLLEFYRENDVTLSGLYFVVGDADLYLTLLDKDGRQILLTTPLDRPKPLVLIEGWAEVRLLNRSPNGRFLLLAGREDPGDDLALYSIEVKEGATPVELDDDADDFFNAIFMSDNTRIVYTAKTGSRPDDVEVRRGRVDGREPYETLYEEAALVDVQWARLNPFSSLFWQHVEARSSFCPNARALTLGTAREDTINSELRNCYRVRIQSPDLYTFMVESSASVNTRLDLYDRDGNYIAGDDDSGSGSNPLLKQHIQEAGLYYITVSGYSGSAGEDFKVTVLRGVTDPAFAGATSVSPGEQVRGAITSDTRIYVEAFSYDGYGVMYSFEGKTGEQVTIDVLAGSIGSILAPVVYLFDPGLNVVTYDYSGGGTDVRLTYTLARPGRHYILILSSSENYGSSSDYFFELLLTTK